MAKMQDSLEQKMILWVREMKFVEEIFGDGIHGKSSQDVSRYFDFEWIQMR